jgi:hypothetical protein
VLDPSPTPGDPAISECLCIGCEYDLRGLPDEGQCPECGSSIAESRRAFEGDIRIPRALKAVSFLFILVGSLSLVWFVPHLVARQFEVPLGVCGIPIGFGLLRLSNRWRIAALVVLAMGLAVRVWALPFAVLGPAPFEFIILGVPAALVPRVYAISWLAFSIVVIGSMIRVLLDPRLRTMCRVLGPRVRIMGLRLCARFQRRLAILCGASPPIGLFLAGILLVFAEDFDAFLLRRAGAVQGQAAAQESGATSAQAASRKSRPTSAPAPEIIMTLDWREPDSYSTSGPYFTSTLRERPLTGKLENNDVTRSRSAIRRIEEKYYMYYAVSRRGEGLENTEARGLEWLHHMDSSAGQTDIRLTCRVPIEIIFKQKAATTVTDLKTNRLLQPPYVLEPGEYHLQATKLSR